MKLCNILPEPPRLEGKRILLRGLEERDSEGLYNYYNNKLVQKYVDWDGPRSTEHAKEVIKMWNKGFYDNWILRLAISERQSDNIIGTIFFNSFDYRRAEIGYDLAQDWWHKGIMSEAFKLFIPFGIDKLNLYRIQAFIAPENTASSKLVERHGFKKEGCLRQYEWHNVRNECKDMDLWSLLKDEYPFKDEA